MNIETLRIFCDVVLHQSFSQGAMVNDVSQSAATQSIHRLEKSIGVKLVDRSRRPLVLTPEGQVCYDGFRGILEAYDTIITNAQTLNKKERGTVSISSIYSVGYYPVDKYIKEFMRYYPKTKIKQEYHSASDIYQAVLSSEIDIGIVSYPFASQNIAMIPLQTENMVFACSLNHPLASRTMISLEQIQGADFIAFERELTIRKEIDRYLRQRLVTVNIVAEYENIETIKQAVEIGFGCSILPQTSVVDDVKLGKLIAIPLTDPVIQCPLGLIYKIGKVFTPALTKFVELVSDAKNGRCLGDETMDYGLATDFAEMSKTATP